MELVFKDTFDISNYGGKSKLFKVKPAQVAYKLEAPVDPMTPEGQEIQTMMQTAWTKQMAKWKAEREKEYKAALKYTEESLLKKAAAQKGKIKDVEKWLNEEVKGAQVMIANAMKTLESQVKTVAEDLWTKATARVDKKFKSEIKSMKIKAAFRIVTQVGIIVAATAVAIVAAAAGVVVTAATEGVGAVSAVAIIPVVAASLVAIGKAGHNIYKAYDAAWPNHKKAADTLAKELAALQKAVEYSKRKRLKKDTTGKLGPKETIKLLLTDVKGKKSAVEKSLKTAATWSGNLRQECERLAVEITKMQEPIDDLFEKANGGDAKSKKAAEDLVKKQAQLLAKLNSCRSYIGIYDKMLEDAEKVIHEKLDDDSRLGSLIATVNKLRNDPIVKEVSTHAKPVFTGIKTTVVAIQKAA